MPDPILIRLKFLGDPMGTLAYRADDATYALQLDPTFMAKGHDLSPFKLPLESFARGPRLFRAGDTPFPGGLPGLIADSVPDKWGQRMLKLEVPEVTTLIGKLAVIGERGPGAISFEPVLGKGADLETVSANLSGLAKDADTMMKSPVTLTPEEINAALAKGGGSLGGLQPKVAAHLPAKGELHKLTNILIGGPTPPGHVPCIVKLSPLDDEGGGTVEFAFWKMAQQAGIRVPQACLVHDGERRHFAVARFDRYLRAKNEWARRHVHTLSGMLHQLPADGNIDYEDFIRLSRRLGGAEDALECFRRIVFNLLSTNRDDHGRNHAFLYDENTRTWSLTPAYDQNPNLISHFIALYWQGRATLPDHFDQLVKLAELGGISAPMVRTVFDQVAERHTG